jgi:hypothetical protein
MKYLIALTGILLSLTACLPDNGKPEINGMWQLKTLSDENQNTQTVDTVFYSFQRQAVFSCTLLHENAAANYSVIYGYMDFPDDAHLHVLLDKGYFERAHLLPWNWGGDNKANEVVYDIITLNAKRMVLFHPGKNILYSFIKY